MSKEEVLESNKLIAAFMGFNQKLSDNKYKIPSEPGYGKLSDIIFIDSCEYNSSLDWLMPVIEKIEGLENVRINEITIGIVSTMIYARNRETNEFYQPMNYSVGETRLDRTYNAVVEFIKWYNQNKSNETN